MTFLLGMRFELGAVGCELWAVSFEL